MVSTWSGTCWAIISRMGKLRLGKCGSAQRAAQQQQRGPNRQLPPEALWVKLGRHCANRALSWLWQYRLHHACVGSADEHSAAICRVLGSCIGLCDGLTDVCQACMQHACAMRAAACFAHTQLLMQNRPSATEEAHAAQQGLFL